LFATICPIAVPSTSKMRMTGYAGMARRMASHAAARRSAPDQ
jgi:hypothetical protein